MAHGRFGTYMVHGKYSESRPTISPSPCTGIDQEFSALHPGRTRSVVPVPACLGLPTPLQCCRSCRAADERPGAKPPKHWRSMSRTAPLHHARASRWLPLPCPDCPDCLFANRHTSCCCPACPPSLSGRSPCVVFAPAIAHRLRACHPLGCTAAVTRV